MKQEQAIAEELKMLESRLAALPKLQPFRLPAADYLSVLPGLLTETIRYADAAEPVPDWSRSLPFDAPAGYFDGLAESLARTARLSERPPVPFETPPGYFDQLPRQLLEGIQSPELPARKTVSFRPVWRKTLPWIAAAALLSGVWIGIGREPGAAGADTRALQALAVLDRDSIGNYVELHADDFDPESLEAALAGGQVTDFRQAVSELRSDEIEDYLDDVSPQATPSKGT